MDYVEHNFDFFRTKCWHERMASVFYDKLLHCPKQWITSSDLDRFFQIIRECEEIRRAFFIEFLFYIDTLSPRNVKFFDKEIDLFIHYVPDDVVEEYEHVDRCLKRFLPSNSLDGEMSDSELDEE